MVTLHESTQNMRVALHNLGVAIGDTVNYPIITARIDRLHKKTDRLPLFSWERYKNRREIQRLVEMKTVIESRIDDK